LHPAEPQFWRGCGLAASYKRGCQEKVLLLPLQEGTDAVACIQPNLSSGEAAGSPRIPDKPGSRRFALDGFMTPGSFDAFGSGSFASKRVGFSGPTMVLSETRGLQLSWVMRGGIRCIWRLGAERQHAGPSSLIDTLPRPRASQEPIG
jgi:hypothetical protein